MRSGRFDAYSNALGFSDTYSNLFLLQPIATSDAVAPVSSLTSALPRYDLSGRVVTTDHPPRGIYIQNGKKVVR